MSLKKIEKPFFSLAPMAGISTYPFLSQCMEFGAEPAWMPMVHTDMVLNNWTETRKIIGLEPYGQPGTKSEKKKSQIVQLAGSSPDEFVKAVKVIEKNNIKPLSFDINAGCPDKNIVKSGCGGALLKEPEKVIEIIKSIRNTTRIPVSIKTRAGFTSPKDIYNLAPDLVRAGVAMITVHPRTVSQKYGGTADRKIVSDVKKELRKTRCLVVGSGDVKSWQEAILYQKEVGCDGLLIGRGALGRPWIFTEIKKRKEYDSSLDEIKKLVLDLSEKHYNIWGNRGIVEARKHYGWYFKGFRGAKEIRSELMTASTLTDVKKIIKKTKSKESL